MGIETEPVPNHSEELCIHGLPRAWCSECNPLEPPPRKQVVHLKKRTKSEGRRRYIEGLHILGIEDDPSGLSPRTEALHISQVPTGELMKNILKACPNLRVVEFPPSSFKQYVRRNKVVTSLLNERDVDILIGRWVEREKDLDSRDDHEYYQRREYLVNLPEKKKQILLKAKEKEFESAEMLWQYFCLEEPTPPRISLIDLALEYGTTLQTTVRKILGFLGLLGYPLRPKYSKGSAGRLRTRIQRALRAETQALERIEFEKYQPIPPGLPSGQWEYFLQLTEIQHQSPEVLEELAQELPRTHFALVKYFGLEDGVYCTLEEVGNSFDPPISRERVRQLRNSALEQLDILTE